jgi:hypothetical protein
MAIAAETVMPEQRRKVIMAAFQHLPLRLQHHTVQKLEAMQGSVLSHRGDTRGAFESYKRAATIGYSVIGATFIHCKDLWRLVGSAMHCGLQDEAVLCLEKIRDTNCFATLDHKQTRQAFVDLTLKYAAPWWVDPRDACVQRKLRLMAGRVWDGKLAPSSTASGGKKKHSKKKGILLLVARKRTPRRKINENYVVSAT